MVHAPAFFESLGASSGTIGLLYSASAALGLLLRPLFGRILDITHRRNVLAVATITNLVATAGLLLVVRWSYGVWGLFLVHRACRIALIASALTYAADVIIKERRTQGLAIFGLAGLVPIAIGGLLGDVAIALLGFDGLFWGAVFLELAALAIVLRLPKLPVLGPVPRRGFWVTIRQRDLIPIWVAAFTLSAGFNTLFTFAKTLTLARNVGSAGLLFGAYGISAGAVRVAIGPRYDRSPHRTMIVGSILAYAMALVMLAFAESIPMLLGAGIAAGLAHGTMFPILTSQLATRSRLAERGSAMTILTSVFDVSVLLVVPVAGLMIDRFGYVVGFSVVAAVTATGAPLFASWDAATKPAPGGE